MTIDYAKLTVGQIKDMLVQEGRYAQEEIDNMMDVKGKAAWVEIHQGQDQDKEEIAEEYDWAEVNGELDGIIEEVEDMVTEDEPVQQIKVVDPDTPGYNDFEWNDWVMAQLHPDELVAGKYPNVNGLRRMVGLLLGDIVFSGPIQTQVTDSEDIGKAVVTYQITIDWRLDNYPSTMGIDLASGYPQRIFTAVASGFEGNLTGLFIVFPEAMAETRAEVRALRKALRISTVGAEELTQKDVGAYLEERKNQQVRSTITTGEWEEESFITDQQVNVIRSMCDRLNIDVDKFIQSGKLQYKSINDISKGSAAIMLNELNRYQNSGEDSKDIPAKLLK